MGITIGPSDWWSNNPTLNTLECLVALCPVGSTLSDGSRIICKAGGCAWIVAPASTDITTTWTSNTNTLVGDKCCVCDWSTLCSRMISCGFNPSDWFVPNISQLQNPGNVCRTQWDFTAAPYWSSTEIGACFSCFERIGTSGPFVYRKNCTNVRVRAFRTVIFC